MAIFVLVRHGQTAGNRDKIYRGRWDLPLDDRGLEQVKRAGEALSGLRIDAVYTSPLERTRQTARAIAVHHGLEPVDEQGLLDLDYGRWTRRPDAEVRQQEPELYRQWLERPESVVFPEGEGLSDVRARVEGMFERLAAKHPDGTAVLAGHRVSVKVALLYALGLGNEHFWRIQVDTASISAVRFDGERFVLLFANDTGHLKGMPDRIRPVDF